jgi:hypothetical protein
VTRLRVVIVATAFALFATALGIALGAGPLQDDMHDAFLRRPVQQEQDPEERRRETALQQTVAYDKDAVTTLAPSLLAGRLQDRPVAVLSLPSADEAQVEAVISDIEAAEGSVTTRLRVAPDLVNPSARTLVDTLSAGQVNEYDDLDVPADADVYERVGLVLGRALVTGTDTGQPLDDAASAVLNGFTTADLLSGQLPEQRASLAVIVAGAKRGEDEGDAARASIISTLARTIGGQGDGAVVAGPRPAAKAGGAVAAIRNDDDARQQVSTIDTLDTRMGQVGTVLTLAEQASGGVGHYGAVGAPDGAMPR